MSRKRKAHRGESARHRPAEGASPAPGGTPPPRRKVPGALAALAPALLLAFSLAFVPGDISWKATAFGISRAVNPELEEATVVAGDVEIRAELARDPMERRIGLSNRESLEEGRGMLFLFDEDAPHSFWMKDMNFSIDMVWMNSNRMVVHIEEDVSPETFPRSFRPRTLSRYVLEVPAGYAAKSGIKVGDTLSW